MKKTVLMMFMSTGFLLFRFFAGKDYFTNKVALITGGSKGLGFILAKHLSDKNCKVAVCARDQKELDEVFRYFKKFGKDILPIQCDVSDREQVQRMIESVIDHYGQLDFIFNNAGIITVGSMEALSEKEYRTSMDVMYWGIVNTTLSALPYMKKRHRGHIVNITSIGGKVSVPHLLAYNSAKFAAVGFSEGLAAELRKDNIYVTTIVPGLMRTGSYVNAMFPEGEKQEFKLFSLMGNFPFISIDADKAARRILKAVAKKKVLKVIGIQTRIAIELHHFFPNLTVKIFALINRFLPFTENRSFEKGQAIGQRHDDAEVPGVRMIGHRAQEEHQLHG